MKNNNRTAVVLPQKFTGREPVVIDTTAVRSLSFAGDPVILRFIGGSEVELRPERRGPGGELSSEAMDALAALVFGEGMAERSREIAQTLSRPWEWVNPALICSVEFVTPEVGSPYLRVCIQGEKPIERRGVDFDQYRRITGALYGSELAGELTPWKAPKPLPAVLEMVRKSLERRKSREVEAATEAEARERARVAAGATVRYSTQNSAA